MKISHLKQLNSVKGRTRSSGPETESAKSLGGNETTCRQIMRPMNHQKSLARKFSVK